MKKLIFILLTLFSSCTASLAQQKAEYIIFRDTTTGRRYAMKIYPNFHPSGGSGNDTVFVVGTSGDQELPNTVTGTRIGGVAIYNKGSISSYAWTQDSGAVSVLDSNVAMTSISGLNPASVYRYKLTAINNLGDSAYAYLRITVDSSNLQPDEYFVTDSAKLFFSPSPAVVSGRINIHGDPAAAEIDTAIGNGWSINTISTSVWNPYPATGTSSTDSGEVNTQVNDFGGYVVDSAAITHNFVNYHSDFTGSNYNLQLTGLDTSLKYTLHLLGSRRYAGGYDGVERVGYTVKGLYSAVTKNMLAIANTSSLTIFDTVKPAIDGTIDIAVTGEDTTLSVGGANGWLSTLDIYSLSKTESSGSKISLFRHRDTFTVTLATGIDGLVYFPKDFDQTKRYPVILYLGGQGSAGGTIDALRQEGLPAALEAGQDVFGIDSTGDTIRYVVIAPHNPDPSKFSFDTSTVNTFVTYIKTNAASLYADSANVNITGLSSGGISALNYTLSYPYQVKNCYAVCTAGLPSSYDLQHGGQGLVDNGAYVMLWSHADQYTTDMQKENDSLMKYASGHVLYGRWWNRLHDGFNWDYYTDNKRVTNGQNVYDFFADPTKEIGNSAGFQFVDATSFPSYNFNVLTGMPNDSIISRTDPTSSIKVENYSTSGWDGAGSSALINPPSSPNNYGTLFNSVQYRLWYAHSKSYSSNGNNLKITGLKPNTNYDIIMTLGSHNNVNEWNTYGVNGTGFQNLNSYANYSGYVLFTATSDSSGEIDASAYPASNSATGFGGIGYMIVRIH